MAQMKFRSLGLCLILLLFGCAGKTPRIIGVRDVSRAGSAPQIDSVLALGQSKVPAHGVQLDLGQARAEGVIGELLLIRGDDFGKQPTVTIGKQPAAVLAFVKGGFVVRVPWGIDAGEVELVVSNRYGPVRRRLKARRLGVVALGQKLVVVDVRPTGSKVVSTIALPGAERVSVSTEGLLAFVVGGRPVHLTVMDLTTRPPSKRRTERMPGEAVVGVAVASHAPLGAVVTDTHVVFLDQRRPADLALYSALALPDEVTGERPFAVAMSPKGDLLALLLGKGNRVALFDTKSLAALQSPKIVDVLPGSPLELLFDLRFGPSGKTLWVVSGNNPSSVSAGDQPTRVSRLDIASIDSANVAETIEVAALDVPFGIAVSRGDPTPPGTAIRSTVGASALFVAGGPLAMIRSGKPDLAAAGTAAIVRIESGKPPVVVSQSSAWRIGSLDLAGKTDMLVALGAQGQTRLLLACPAWQDRKPARSDIGAIDPSTLRPPLLFGEIRLQP